METITTIKTFSSQELATKVLNLKKELGSLNIKKRSGQLEKPHKLSQLKKQIARHETISTQKLQKLVSK